MAEWYRSNISQHNRELVPYSGSADRPKTNGQPGGGHRINERWDAHGLTGGLLGLRQGTLNTIYEWRDAWGSTKGSVQQYKIYKQRGTRGVTEGISQ